MRVNSHRGRRVKVYSLLRGKRAKPGTRGKELSPGAELTKE